MKNRYSISLLTILYLLTCPGMAPQTKAVSPAPDGGYPGNNTAEGTDALFSLPAGGGTDNVGLGFDALYHNTSGCCNTATGSQTLQNNTTGNENTATGFEALSENTYGYDNTATGFEALGLNATGVLNTATGSAALLHNTYGNENAALGGYALLWNTSGSNNTAVGVWALGYNTTGYDNTAIGHEALGGNGTGTTGFNNTASGFQALQHITTGFNNTAIGSRAGFYQTTGSNNVYIGANVNGVAGESNTCYIRGIYGNGSSGGLPVYVNFNNKLGTVTSSKRFKDDIEPMDKASEPILALKPVTFRYKKDFDPAGIPQFGLVAEDVDKVDSSLVVRDNEGKPYSVRYDAVNAMLLNEFLKEHKKVEEEAATIAELKSIVEKQEKGMAYLAAHVKDQDAKIQSVSIQLKMGRSEPKVVTNQPQKGSADWK